MTNNINVIQSITQEATTPDIQTERTTAKKTKATPNTATAGASVEHRGEFHLTSYFCYY